MSGARSSRRRVFGWLAGYAAAKKVGMSAALSAIHAEVCTSGVHHPGSPNAGKNFAFIAWENELAADDDDFVFPREAFERATAWLKKYGTAKGWTVS